MRGCNLNGKRDGNWFNHLQYVQWRIFSTVTFNYLRVLHTAAENLLNFRQHLVFPSV